MTCIEVPLNSFGADTFNVAGSDLPGLKTISLYIISYFSPKKSDWVTDDSVLCNCKLICYVNKYLLYILCKLFLRVGEGSGGIKPWI